MLDKSAPRAEPEEILPQTEIPDGKQIIGQVRARDDSQLYDNLIPGDNPFYLAAAGRVDSVNRLLVDETSGKDGAPVRLLPGAIPLGVWEGGGGASAEINVLKGVHSLRALRKQIEALPKTLPDGSPYVISFLSRAKFGFTREYRSPEDREFQFRCYAEECQKQGVVCRIDIFDTMHRAEWLEEDYRIIYNLRKQGLPIVIGGMTGVSDDETLTPDAFRARVRSVLEMDAKVRMEVGETTSAMLIHTLKNTDGRLRGDGASFGQGNAALYGDIQFQEIDRIWGIHQTGPRQAGFHTHNTGLKRANNSTEAYSDAYLNFKPAHAVFAAVIDLIPKSEDFPGYRRMVDRLRKRDWKIPTPPRLFVESNKLGVLFSKATSGFRANLPYEYTQERAERFHCAPAALSSGIRFGAMPAVEQQMEQLRKIAREGDAGTALERLNDVTGMNRQVTETMIDAWGCLNEVMQRLLVGYSITPVANYDNTTAGDILAKLVDKGFINEHFIKTGKSPLAMTRDDWEMIALDNLDAVKQVAAANYLTRKDTGVEFQPKVFQRLITLRTGAVLPVDQEKSYFAGMKIADYAALRSELLSETVLNDKAKAAQVLARHGIPARSAKSEAFVAKYIEWDTSEAGKNLPVIVQLAEAKAEELSAGDAELKRELLFAASVGSLNSKIPEKQMEVLATTPAHTHINVLWWVGVTNKNQHEDFILRQFKNYLGNKQFYTVAELVARNPGAALDAMDCFIANRDKCRNDFGIIAALENPELLKYKEIQERRAAFLRSAYGVLAPKSAWSNNAPSLFGDAPAGSVAGSGDGVFATRPPKRVKVSAAAGKRAPAPGGGDGQ